MKIDYRKILNLETLTAVALLLAAVTTVWLNIEKILNEYDENEKS